MTAAQAGAEWLLAIPFALLGVPLLVTGAVMLKRRVTARLGGLLVDAVVVEREVHLGLPATSGALRRRISTVTPCFKYRAADGEERLARLDHQTRQRLRSEGYRLRYPLGARVRVRIDPVHPEIAYDDGIGSMIVFPGLLLLAGTLMTLLALGIYFGARS